GRTVTAPSSQPPTSVYTVTGAFSPPRTRTVLKRSSPSDGYDGAPLTSMSGTPPSSPRVSKVGPGRVAPYGSGRRDRPPIRSAVVTVAIESVRARGVTTGSGAPNGSGDGA